MKESEELSRVESGHKETLEMLNKEKDKIMGTLQESLEKENTKMESMHQGDLSNKEKIYKENVESLKVQLTKENMRGDCFQMYMAVDTLQGKHFQTRLGMRTSL